MTSISNNTYNVISYLSNSAHLYMILHSTKMTKQIIIIIYT